MEVKNYINPYKEVNDNIFVCQVKLAGYEKDLRRIIELSGPKPVQAQQYDTSIGSDKVENVNDLYKIIVETKKQIEEMRAKIDELKAIKKQIEENFMKSCLNETERRVFLLKQHKTNYSYEEIGYKINKSEKTIRNISSIIDRKMSVWLRNLPNNQIIL